MNLITISPKTTQLGWIGTGVMGRWMCQHCLDAGFAVTVYNRTPAKAQPLVDAGATLADSPKTVAQNADIIFSIVGYPQDVREILLGEDGVLNHCRPESILVDMTTSEPSLAVEIFNRAQNQGVHSLDAPVSGGDVGARNATLSIMAGGEQVVFEALTPLWQAMGKTFNYMGPAGRGQHTKMVNQIAIASGMVAMVEALLYSYRAGLDLNTVLKAISQGAAGSWSLSHYAPRIIERNFDPGFYVEHFVKDLEIALHEASRMNLSLPGLALAHQLYVALKAQGHSRLGTHALILALEQLNQITHTS